MQTLIQLEHFKNLIQEEKWSLRLLSFRVSVTQNNSSWVISWLCLAFIFWSYCQRHIGRIKYNTTLINMCHFPCLSPELYKMERHNWNVSKYNRSEFILFFFFFPAWTCVTSDFNLEWVTFTSDLQIFQMKYVVWKQNKCLLGPDFSVMRTYQIRKKTDENAGCAC